MSKLALALQFNQAGRVPKQSMDFVSAELGTEPLSFDTVYRLSARLEAKAVVTQELQEDSVFNAIELTKRRLQRLVIEEIFGEFRAPLHEIRKAIYHKDSNKLDQLWVELYNQMFHEGID